MIASKMLRPTAHVRSFSSSAVARHAGCGGAGHVHGPWCNHGGQTVLHGHYQKIGADIEPRAFATTSQTGNRGVVYVEPGKVEVRGIGYPKLEEPNGRKANHGVILKCLATNICGSDQVRFPC